MPNYLGVLSRVISHAVSFIFGGRRWVDRSDVDHHYLANLLKQIFCGRLLSPPLGAGLIILIRLLTAMCDRDI